VDALIGNSRGVGLPASTLEAISCLLSRSVAGCELDLATDEFLRLLLYDLRVSAFQNLHDDSPTVLAE